MCFSRSRWLSQDQDTYSSGLMKNKIVGILIQKLRTARWPPCDCTGGTTWSLSASQEGEMCVLSPGWGKPMPTPVTALSSPHFTGEIGKKKEKEESWHLLRVGSPKAQG